MRALLLIFLSGFAVAGCKTEALTDMGGGEDMAVEGADLAREADMAKAPGCTDGVKNGRETDVDCGGDCPSKCGAGKGCMGPEDCTTGLCGGGRCVAPSCMDGLKNGDETGVDCGGSCAKPCRAGEGCTKNAECASLLCTSGVCAPPSCGDGLKNGSESDVDCGGGACRQCVAGQACREDADCYTKICDANQNICVGCGDGKKNGTESDVDCGGKLCDACGIGKACAGHNDCDSRLCAGGVCTACQVDNDCPFKICKAGVCSNAPVVGMLGNQTFFKVEVKGAMTDTNVFNACKAAGLNTPCQAQGNCMYNDNVCTMTQESACGNPMQTLSYQLCGKGVSPSSCPALYGCYQYMGHKWTNDSACGAEQGQWCAQGSNQMNRYALCVN